MIPFLKWAGGKRWLFDNSFVAALPPFERYIEPFLGGGAAFFALNPKRAVLSDVNKELIELYEVIRDFPVEVQTALERHHALHSRDYYYAMRAAKPDLKFERAIRTLYLNRSCWNGLYRLNQRGEFNVPIGTKTAIVLPSDDFKGAAKALASAELRHCDFEEAIETAGEGDFVFADPPYTVRHNVNGFVKYNEKLFKWSDQIRLRDALLRAAARGAKVVLTNANHDSVTELYDGIGRQSREFRSSVISGKSDGRAVTSELVIYI